MCEELIASAAEPFRADRLWDMAERLERYGLAGFGWGAAWLAPDGSIGRYRDVRAFRDDAGRQAIGAIETTRLLVHLRRPSRLSTLGIPDTQPFLDPAGRFAFAHNGDLGEYRLARERYRRAGRIQGRADSEVAARWLEDEWRPDEPSAHTLAALHDAFGGNANLGLLDTRGLHLYAGNRENPVFAFRLGAIEVASTGIYSLDRSLFRFVVPAATARRLVPLRSTVSFG